MLSLKTIEPWCRAYDWSLYHPSHLANPIDEAGDGPTKAWLAPLSYLDTEQNIDTVLRNI